LALDYDPSRARPQRPKGHEEHGQPFRTVDKSARQAWYTSDIPKIDQTKKTAARHEKRAAGSGDATAARKYRMPFSGDIRVGKRGQIVLPAALRRELGIEDGSKLAVNADGEGRIVLEPVPSDPIRRFIEAGRGV